MLNEFKFIFKNRKLMISLISISLVSAIYVAMFVGSVFNPYDRTKDLKISVVNHDKSIDTNGKTISIGDDLVNKLKDKNTFDFQSINEKEALKRLKSGESSGTIIIPEDTSKNALTILSKDPKKINIETQVNPGASYIGSQTSKKALDIVIESINQNIRTKYLTEIFNNVNKSKSSQTTTQQKGMNFDKNNEMVLNNATKVTENNPTNIDYYGESIVPYMAGVSLFVVAISICAIYPFRKTINRDTPVIKQTLGKFMFYIVEGTLAAILMNILVIFVFQIHIDHIAQFIVMSILWGIAAISITSFLGLLLDRIGLFLSMILLVFQLSSSEGMFPIELSPKFFQLINPLSPMSYVIQGFREAMFTNAGHYSYGVAISVVIGIIIVMALLQFLVLKWFNGKDKLPFAMEFK
ncbi:YhgE/Pip family protein [Mammaliicoccus sp. Dog046]|uniref:YhgE/Pip domain-containing protein n=1 Tax=Mammaliicoccus sp. Dog046 TaxID=3034233 RepID=UPI002B25BCD1|nr:YhgE/Pip family protein [Mammaliicoccus sp. Dog046]WQK84805.1 YhgE/Pip family protein [Mammaliicoccus sp. Dog046]